VREDICRNRRYDRRCLDALHRMIGLVYDDLRIRILGDVLVRQRRFAEADSVCRWVLDVYRKRGFAEESDDVRRTREALASLPRRR
jgi:hypothetical protein